MKKIILSIWMCGIAVSMMAQQMMSSQEMVAITPMLSTALNLPNDAKASLGTKLNQMVTQNGFGSLSGDFVLTANVVTLDKQVTATAPAQYIVELEVSVFVLNVAEELAIDEMSFVVKGIDRLENKATIQAINQIKPKSPQARAFMNGCREKIISFYNTRIPALMTKAQELANRQEYDEALAVLGVIPEMVDQYPMVVQQMTAIFMQKIDLEAQAAIQEAKSMIALREYESALTALLNVDPASSKSPEAFRMIEQVKSTIDAKEAAELARQMQMYEDQKEASARRHDDAVMLEKLRIDATKAIYTERAKTETSVASKLNKWFTSKFK